MTSDKISVIIPSNQSHELLNILLDSLINQTLQPYEIIIIDSSENKQLKYNIEKKIIDVNVNVNININIIHHKVTQCLPGAARNLGLSLASGDYIAFLDVLTIPSLSWLKNYLTYLKYNNCIGVYGFTIFYGENYKSLLIRDAIYGKKGRITLPGSIFNKSLFNISGQFLNWVRAGEDTDWLIRIKLMKLNIYVPEFPEITYYGIRNIKIIDLVNKWKRNYYSSRFLPHFNSQRYLTILTLYPLFIMLAFNWNAFLANWNEGSIFYIGNITKIVILFPPLIYLLTRSIILPIYRGVNLVELLPFRFLLIALLCMYLDTIKISMLFSQLFNRK
jgi:glycosyltransferase involved in cell wall biosynthesis